MAGVFLTATWRNLLLVNYDVDPALLAPHLPPGCELDLLNGRAMLSLVAFEFADTRVLGIPWPGYRTFAEVNLRYYVRRGDQRGVSFISELVPQRLVAWLAKLTYNEPYRAVPIRLSTDITTDRISTHHQLQLAGKTMHIRAKANAPAEFPQDGAIDDWFKEQAWGFTRSRRNTLTVYRVEHERWRVYPKPSVELDFDFAAAYGDKWGVLNHRSPHSVVFAEGSPIKVYVKSG